MTTDEAPALHALALEPSVARPGDVVRVTFRARNVGTLNSPPGAVVVALPAGLEPLDTAEAALPSVEPGEIAEATLCVRVLPAHDDGRELRVQAQLVLPGVRATTNACTLRLDSRAVLDGGASGTFVDRVDDDTFRVRALVRNEGDAVARDVRVYLPVPAGCRRLDGDETLEIERLGPGEATELAFTAQAEYPMCSVRADRARVEYGSTMRALTVRGELGLEPRIVAPLVDVRAERRRFVVAVTLGNEGWSCAHDVALRITLPPGFQLAASSVAVDGAPISRGLRRANAPAIGRLRQQDGACDIVVAIVSPRAAARLTFAATHDGSAEPGVLRLQCGEYVVDVALRPQRYDDVRVEVLALPPGVVSGATAALRARVVNAGDGLERLRIALDGARLRESMPVERTLPAGTFALVDLPIAFRDDARDAAPIPFALVVSDAHGERARSDLLVTVASAVPPAFAEPEAAPCSAAPIPPVVHAVLLGPGEALRGAAFAIRLIVDAEDAVERLTIRAINPPGSYVTASTKAGGCAVLDRRGRAPLEDGLEVRAIAPGTRLAIDWSVVVTEPSGDGTLTVSAMLDVDGTPQAVEAIAVAVRDAHPFAFRPAGLPYHIDAAILAAPASAAAADTHGTNVAHDESATVDDDAVMFDNPFTPIADIPLAGQATFEVQAPSLITRRWDDVARLVHGVRCEGLILHLLAVRAVFPAADPQAIDAVTIARDAAGDATRELFDRLFVKLRIPNFVPGADDLEDRALRRALLNAADARDDAAGSIALLDAPLGAPVALRALLALVPLADAPVLERALSAYLSALDASLAAYEDAPLEVFEAALARGRDDRLDACRAAFIAALDDELAPSTAAR